jgi:hypothetical protein
VLHVSLKIFCYFDDHVWSFKMTTFRKRWPSLSATVFIALAADGLAFANRITFANEPQSSSTKAPERIFKFDTPGVRLEGTLSERVFYGPPGFGETPDKDARERVLILTLRQPITVVPVEDAGPKVTSSLSTLRDVGAVQLFIL